MKEVTLPSPQVDWRVGSGRTRTHITLPNGLDFADDELKVLERVGEGLTQEQAALSLGRGHRASSNLMTHLLERNDGALKSITHAAAEAQAHGLLDPLSLLGLDSLGDDMRRSDNS